MNWTAFLSSVAIVSARSHNIFLRNTCCRPISISHIFYECLENLNECERGSRLPSCIQANLIYEGWSLSPWSGVEIDHIWACAWDFQQCGMCDQQMLRSACAYAQSDQSLCPSLNYSMSVKLLTEHLLEVLGLKGGCTCSSEPTVVKMPHCWKSHVTAHLESRFSKFDRRRSFVGPDLWLNRQNRLQ